MAGFRHNFDLNEAMGRDPPEYFADQMPRRPEKKIVVRIRVSNLRNVPSEVMDKLTILLRRNHNMELTRSKSSTDIVIVSGIPSVNGFGPQQVLNIINRQVEEWSYAELAEER